MSNEMTQTEIDVLLAQIAGETTGDLFPEKTTWGDIKKVLKPGASLHKDSRNGKYYVNIRDIIHGGFVEFGHLILVDPSK